MKNQLKLMSSLYAFLAVAFWGISFVSAKSVLDELDLFSLITARFAIGAVFLLVLLVITRKKIFVSPQYWPHLFILSIIGVFVHQLLQAAALTSIDASEAGWLIAFSPVFTVILAVIFLRESFSFYMLLGMLTAILGVLFITAFGSGNFVFPREAGYFFMLASTLNWAVYSILLKKLDIPYPSLTITFYISCIGCAVTMPIFLSNGGLMQLQLLSSSNVWHLLFLGVFVTAIAYWFWGKALEIMEASIVSNFMYLEPPVACLAAMLLLKEEFYMSSALGGILIIAGVMAIQASKNNSG
ncbi:EamA family transporter [Bacillus lacus]|uniref:EamA family transporter n=1 Tax=Metabacillus lacus TaxID=1983721 RepID=A0A7X2IWK0_9BACI|nr:DMT family transporter [Metabacillus lacus]MRX70782.1 EamA family transporter [Metabacillus lacus]